MKRALATRLRIFRAKTNTRWASISKETGLSITTLRNCEYGKSSTPSMEKLSAFLDNKEGAARRWQNLDDPKGKIEFYVDPELKSGTVVEYLKKPYLIMEPVTELYQNPDSIKGTISMPDDRFEPIFAKGSRLGLHWIKDKFVLMDRYYLIVDNCLKIYMGIACPVWPETTIEFRPINRKYPSFYIHEPNIKAVFALHRPWSVILKELERTTQINRE